MEKSIPESMLALLKRLSALKDGLQQCIDHEQKTLDKLPKGDCSIELIKKATACVFDYLREDKVIKMFNESIKITENLRQILTNKCSSFSVVAYDQAVLSELLVVIRILGKLIELFIKSSRGMRKRSLRWEHEGMSLFIQLKLVLENEPSIPMLLSTVHRQSFFKVMKEACDSHSPPVKRRAYLRSRLGASGIS